VPARLARPPARVARLALDDEVVSHQVDAQQQRHRVAHVVVAHGERLLEGGRPLVGVARVQHLVVRGDARG